MLPPTVRPGSRQGAGDDADSMPRRSGKHINAGSNSDSDAAGGGRPKSGGLKPTPPERPKSGGRKTADEGGGEGPKGKSPKMRRSRTLSSIQTSKSNRTDPGPGHGRGGSFGDGNSDREGGQMVAKKAAAPEKSKKLRRGASMMTLEEKLAAYEESQQALDHSKFDLAAKEIDGAGKILKDTILKPGAAGTETGSLAYLSPRSSMVQHGVSAEEKEKARIFLNRVVGARKADHAAELVKWMGACDLLYGFTHKELLSLSTTCKEIKCKEGRPIVRVGDLESTIYIVFDGQSAVYTSAGSKGAELFEGNRARMAMPTRRKSVVGHDKARRTSVVADGGRTMAQAARRKSVAADGQKTEKAEEGRRASVAIRRASTGGGSGDEDDEESVMPVRHEFNEGDSFGVQQAFHNVSHLAEYSRKGGEVDAEDTVSHATHTVTAETDTTLIAFSNTEDVLKIKMNYERAFEEKVLFLSSIPSYGSSNMDSIQAMANVVKRIRYPPQIMVVREGQGADKVFFLQEGRLKVIKNAGQPDERVLNVVGEGTCFGDWGVVNNKPRGASMVTLTDCVVHELSAVQYKATVDPTVLGALKEKVQKIQKIAEGNKNRADSDKAINALVVQTTKGSVSGAPRACALALALQAGCWSIEICSVFACLC